LGWCVVGSLLTVSLTLSLPICFMLLAHPLAFLLPLGFMSLHGIFTLGLVLLSTFLILGFHFATMSFTLLLPLSFVGFSLTLVLGFHFATMSFTLLLPFSFVGFSLGLMILLPLFSVCLSLLMPLSVCFTFSVGV
jgi:hypothetical protein